MESETCVRPDRPSASPVDSSGHRQCSPQPIPAIDGGFIRRQTLVDECGKDVFQVFQVHFSPVFIEENADHLWPSLAHVARLRM